MKYNKNGFTLIELLAVIIILSVILAISLPAIIGITEKSKRNAAESSAKLYIKTVEKHQTLCNLNHNSICLIDGNYLVSNGVIENNSMNLIELLIPKVKAEITYIEGLYLNDIIDLTGDKPTSGYLTIKGTKVTYGSFSINGYDMLYDGYLLSVMGKVDAVKDTYAPIITLKTTETTSIMRNVDTNVSSLFNITWAESGSGSLICIDENNNVITNINSLTLGNYTITCKAKGNTGLESNPVTKNIKVIMATSNIDGKDYYLLHDTDELVEFRNLVNNGFPAINAKLMNDINLNDVLTDDSLIQKTPSLIQMTKYNKTFTSTGTDPMIVFNNLSVGQISNITINLSAPLPVNIEFQVFYMGDGIPLSETNSVKKIATSGTTSISIPIPTNNYNSIRLDFGYVSGVTFAVNSINYNTDKSLLSGNYILNSDLVENNNTFLSTGIDPHISYSGLSSGQICNVDIILSSPLSKTTEFQVFYVGDGIPLSEANSVRKSMASGTKNISINIPCNIYHTIRLDFGSTNGVYFPIKDIRYNNTWIPIAINNSSKRVVYTGIFDGNNKTISNIHINNLSTTTDDYLGLFGSNNGTIKNLNVSGKITGYNYIGGMVGINNTAGRITNCNVSMAINGNTQLGGVVGVNYGTITNAISNGSISGNDKNIGGVVGVNYGTTLNSYNNSSVIGKSQGTGGIAGLNINGGKITSCYNKGIITGAYDVGGIAGINYGNGSTISDSYNKGSITATSSDPSGYALVGGIAGDNNSGTIIRTYNIGAVTASKSHVGGITGAQFNSAKLTYSYNAGIIKYNTTTATVDVNTTPALIIGNNTSGTYSNIGGAITLANLGSAFKADTNLINNGFPILDWQ